jgi:hypothetical protein
VSITTRNPGEWKHGISVASTGQKQYQRSSVVAGTVNPMTWTVFATVKTVTPMYSLQNAITSANGSTAPVLIQVDHSQFDGGVADLTVASNSFIPITNEIVIDGTDIEGNPSPLADFPLRVYPTIVTLNPADRTQPNASTFKATAKVGLIGLDIRRILGDDSTIQSVDQPIVWLAANSKSSFIRNTRIDGGAAARGNTCNGGNKTCIYGHSVGSTGFTDAPVVEQSEVRHCFGRAASINDGHLVMRDNWLHHNRKGGLLADSNKGKVQLARNLIEDDGKNCPGAMRCTADGSSFGAACTVTSSCPASDGCSGTGEFCAVDPNYANDPAACNTSYTESSVDAVVVENNTNEANAARVETDGDVVRNASGRGIVLRENAEADIKNTYICGMGINGIDVNHDPTPAPTPKMNVHGSAMAFNARGVQIHRDAADPGGRPGNINFGDQVANPIPAARNPGNNAFALNGSTKDNFAYGDLSGGATRFSEGNQWEHCGTGNSCASESSIKSKDVTETAGLVDIGPTQPNRNPDAISGSLTITSVSPMKVTRRGAIVTIVGKGFNAIDGYQSRTPTPGVTGATDCESLADGNKCSPLQGMCVEFKDDSGNWIPADDVLAVTPTTIVVKSSIACSKTTSLRVTRQDNSVPNATFEFTNQFCTN